VKLRPRLLPEDRDTEVQGLLHRSAHKTLSVNDSLIYLIRDGAARQLLQSPIWLNDLHFLLSSSEFNQKGDWDKVSWTLAQVRALSAAWFTFNFLATEWGTSIPSGALNGFESKIGSIRKVLLSRLAKARALYPPGGRSTGWTIQSRFLLRDNVIHALRQLLDNSRIDTSI